MNIQHKASGSKGSFYIEANNERLGEMTYSMAGEDKMIIDHTEVSDKLRGKGAGKKLVMGAVNFARANNIKILPLCPFTRSVFQKHTDIGDVLN